MALSDIVLSKGQLIVILSDSTSGMVSAGKGLTYGVVQKINDLCDITSVGASVRIDNIEKAFPFMMISGTIFYMVDEDNISNQEIDSP